MERTDKSKIIVRVGLIMLIVTVVLFAILLGVGIKKTNDQTKEYNEAVEQYETDYESWSKDWMNSYGRTTKNVPTRPMRNDYVQFSNFVPCIVTIMVGAVLSMVVIAIGKGYSAHQSIFGMANSIINDTLENIKTNKEEKKTNKYCAYCGTLLNDNGHCTGCGATNKK